VARCLHFFDLPVLVLVPVLLPVPVLPVLLLLELPVLPEVPALLLPPVVSVEPLSAGAAPSAGVVSGEAGVSVAGASGAAGVSGVAAPSGVCESGVLLPPQAIAKHTIGTVKARERDKYFLLIRGSSCPVPVNAGPGLWGRRGAARNRLTKKSDLVGSGTSAGVAERHAENAAQRP
jgi:hypothetical protein